MKKMFAIIDCGTTNSRIYILDDNDKVVAVGYRNIGAKDTLVKGKEYLAQGIAEAFYSILNQNDISKENIQCIISSGMITSEFGLKEVPHLMAPVGIDDTAKNVEVIKANTVLPIDIPLLLVPGVKIPVDLQSNNIDFINEIDIMRGEELQVYGALHKAGINGSAYVLFLTSHSKLVTITSDKKISYSTTTISGQFYQAIQNTSIGKSITVDKEDILKNYTYDEIIEHADELTQRVGILRSILMPRFLDTAMDTTEKERNLYACAAIASEDMKAIDNFISNQNSGIKKMVIVGSKERSDIYKSLINRSKYSDWTIHQIFNKKEIDYLTIEGMVQLKKYLDLDIMLK